MPRPIWKGGISFGLVNIPVSLYPASEASEEISFRQLHHKDLALIRYRRVCSAEGVEVPWDEIVRGFEYAKGEFVVMTDEDLAKARVEATQAIDVRDCVPSRPTHSGAGDISSSDSRAGLFSLDASACRSTRSGRKSEGPNLRNLKRRIPCSYRRF